MTFSDRLPSGLAKCGRGRLCRCDNVQPSHFVIVKTWNHESFSCLAVMTKWFRDIIPKAPASFRYGLGWHWSPDKSPRFLPCYSVYSVPMQWDTAVEELMQHKAHHRLIPRSFAFLYRVWLLQTAEPSHLKVVWLCLKTLTSCQLLLCCTQWLLSRDASR